MPVNNIKCLITNTLFVHGDVISIVCLTVTSYPYRGSAGQLDFSLALTRPKVLYFTHTKVSLILIKMRLL